MPGRLQSMFLDLLVTRIYMACISRIVNETSHHQCWESNTWRKGSQAKDILEYYLIIPSHSLSVFPVQHFTHDYRLFGGRGHLLAAFVQPLKQAETMRSCSWRGGISAHQGCWWCQDAHGKGKGTLPCWDATPQQSWRSVCLFHLFQVGRGLVTAI